jgi:hypothetical protein
MRISMVPPNTICPAPFRRGARKLLILFEDAYVNPTPNRTIVVVVVVVVVIASNAKSIIVVVTLSAVGIRVKPQGSACCAFDAGSDR